MELNKNLEWKVIFKKVGSLDIAKKVKNYYGYLNLDGNFYAITLEGTEKISTMIFNTCISTFKKLYQHDIKKFGKPLKEIGMMSEKYNESSFSES